MTVSMLLTPYIQIGSCAKMITNKSTSLIKSDYTLSRESVCIIDETLGKIKENVIRTIHFVRQKAVKIKGSITLSLLVLIITKQLQYLQNRYYYFNEQFLVPNNIRIINYIYHQDGKKKECTTFL